MMYVKVSSYLALTFREVRPCEIVTYQILKVTEYFNMSTPKKIAVASKMVWYLDKCLYSIDILSIITLKRV